MEVEKSRKGKMFCFLKGLANLFPKVLVFGRIVVISLPSLTRVVFVFFRIGIKTKDGSNSIGEKFGYTSGDFGAVSQGREKLFASLSIFTRVDRASADQIALLIELNHPANGFGSEGQVAEELP